MNGSELFKRLKKLGKERGVSVYYGSRRTSMKDRTKEIGEGLLRSMLADLGLTKRDILG
ncbi:MAG TPA: hypothetical protein PKM25_01975 [Candidatus Ozemobacteraceae bacterium]|nr:hypothetical protein [Candidatus Ozemobacteraceae bacterium]